MGRPATKADQWSDLFVDKGEGCWEWVRADSRGYGYVSIRNKKTSTHKLSFRLHYGREPDGVVRHKCDNPVCYRPDHLTDGTNRENSRDMVQRDRHMRGERQHLSKLKPEQVLDIRDRFGAGESKSVLAKSFGVSWQNIHLIVTNRTWADPRNFQQCK